VVGPWFPDGHKWFGSGTFDYVRHAGVARQTG
jgi:hypothetical protein